MNPLQRVAFIGNHLPRRCGIATFTHDLHRAISLDRLDLETGVVVMTDSGRTYDYPAAVLLQIHDEAIDEYVRAADFLNVRALTLSVSSTSMEFSAARPAAISSSCCCDSKCRW